MARIIPERPDIFGNPRADRVKKVAKLSGRSARQRYGQFLVEGPGPVAALIAARPELVRDVYVSPAWSGSEIDRDARAAGLYVHRVTHEVSDALSTDSQGILAVANTDGLEVRLEELPNLQLVAVLPELNDPGNLGTIIRIADAAGADAVVIGPGSAEVTNPKVVRSTTGSLFHIPIVVADRTDDSDSYPLASVFALFRERGIQIVGADGAADKTVTPDAEWLAEPTAWIFGHEARGLSASDRAAADFLASIPIYGKAESLNVAAAAAICLYASATALD